MREWVWLAERGLRLRSDAWSRCAAAIEWASLDRAEGRLVDAEEALNALRGQVPESLQLRWNVEWGRVQAMRSRLPEALAAMRAPAVAPTPEAEAYRAQLVGNALSWCGRRKDATVALKAAYEQNLALDRWSSAGFCALRLSGLARHARRVWLERAERAFDEAQHAIGRGEVESQWGHLARSEGRLDDARRHYLAFLRITRAHGCGDAMFGELNLGMVLLGQERDAEARLVFERVHGEAEAQGEDEVVVAALLGRVVTLARTAPVRVVRRALAGVLDRMAPPLVPDMQALLQEVEARLWRRGVLDIPALERWRERALE